MLNAHKIALLIAAPNSAAGRQWGDYHFAKALARSFQRQGYEVEIRFQESWDRRFDGLFVLVLRGLKVYKPQPQHINIMWNISHPDLVTLEEYEAYDMVYVASEFWADNLRNKLKTPVEPLLQCADTEHFHPMNRQHTTNLLFVGQARGGRSVAKLLPCPYKLTVIGPLWEKIVPRQYVRGDWIPYEALCEEYNSCDILLNDHWEDMRQKGFLSNRLFDGLAAGAFIISDEAKGISHVLPECVVTYDGTHEDLLAKVDYYLHHQKEREACAKKGTELVLQKHTFDQRATKILEFIGEKTTGLQRIGAASDKRRDGNMLVFGLNKHLLDMIEWHPFLMERIKHIYSDEPVDKATLSQLRNLQTAILPTESLKSLPVGTEIVLADEEHILESEAAVEKLNPELDYIGLDEAVAHELIKSVASSKQKEEAQPRVQDINKEKICNARHAFWGGQVRKNTHLRQMTRRLARPGDLIIDRDPTFQGTILEKLPVISRDAIWNIIGTIPILVLPEFEMETRQELESCGCKKDVDYFLAEELGLVKSSAAGAFERKGDSNKPFRLTKSSNPLVSIIVPVHNNWQYTYACLKSIAKNTDDVSYEVILADDASTDQTLRARSIVKNLRVMRNEKAAGFLLNCNKAATLARGKCLHFLNNDTVVKPGWLSSLVKLLEEHDDIGLVGSKLLFPDGRLQEAGGIVWQDGSAWNYGKWQNASDEEYQYVRECDYISGASILVRASVWKRLGGFDLRFLPAYCEDTDLAFRVRELGYKVVYQPSSEVVHYEGVSNGKKTVAGLKQYQVSNQEKFLNRWQNELSAHSPNGQDVFKARGRVRKTILVIDMWVPEWDKNAGSLTTYEYMKVFNGLGLNVVFYAENCGAVEPYVSEYRQMGVEMLIGENWCLERFKKWLNRNGSYIDYIFLQRTNTALNLINLLKRMTAAKIIFYPHDLASVRLQRQAEVEKRSDLISESKNMRVAEDQVFAKADVTYVPGSYECKTVKERFPDKIVRDIPAFLFDDAFFAAQGKPDLAERNAMIFVGGYQHTPNRDAVLWFVKNIFPLIRKKVPNAKFFVVGSNPKQDILALASNDIIVTGYVTDEELKELYAKARVAIVPLRYGAGIKGKVIEAMSCQVPVVTTAIGAEGMADVDKYLDVADTEDDFAACVARYFQDDAYWREKAGNLLAYVREHYSTDLAKKIVSQDIEA